MKSSYTNPYTQAYLAAKQELEQRLSELESIHKRIEDLKRTIESVEPLVNAEGPRRTFGTMNDLCFAVLGANAGHSMTVQDVLRAISTMGITLKYSNPAGIVHTTLMRLTKKPGSPVVLDPPGATFHGGDPVQNGPMRFYWNAAVQPPDPTIPFAHEMQ